MLKSKNAGATATATPYIGRTTLYGTTYYIHSFDGKLLAEYNSTGTCQCSRYPRLRRANH